MAVKSNLIACKPEKFKASMGFKPMTLQYLCYTLTNWAMKPRKIELAI